MLGGLRINAADGNSGGRPAVLEVLEVLEVPAVPVFSVPALPVFLQILIGDPKVLIVPTVGFDGEPPPVFL